MKRAIYLDARERDLARRVFNKAANLLYHSKAVPGPMDHMAIEWTRDEIDQLLVKFEEPEPQKDETVVPLEAAVSE